MKMTKYQPSQTICVKKKENLFSFLLTMQTMGHISLKAPMYGNWNHAKDWEVITTVAGKPSAEEGVSLDASDNIYNDKQNKVELPNLYVCLVFFPW